MIGFFGSLAMLAAFTSGVKIQCNYSMINWGTVDGSLYTCRVTVTSVENPAIITEISGNHLPGKFYDDVRAFTTTHNVLTAIPEGIQSFFANLEVFQWASGNITAIDPSTFAPFPNLSIIHLSANKLVSIDGNLFQHTRGIREIYFRNNLLQHVGFVLPASLNWVDFRSNPCVNNLATNQLDIQRLRATLPFQCPALATTLDPPTTTITCKINEEAQEMKRRIEDLEKQMSELSCSCNPN